jgi:polar amino acid transport system permease protein
VTVAISAAALVASLFIGLFFALAQKSRFLPLRYLSKLYIEAVRGTPLLVQILVFFYVVADAFGVSDRYVVGVLTLSLFAGAYICEIVRAGIECVGESQLESARAIGLTRWQTYRHIVYPQVLRRLLPPLAGQFASIIKDSSLLSIIAVSEFTLNAQEVNAFTYSTLESYLPLAIGYLLLTLPISLASRALERKYRYAT